MNRRILALLISFQVLAAGSAVAQTYAEDEPLIALFTGAHFWIALVVGVVLAAGFQILMTNLSVAAGVSMVGPVDEKAKRREARKRSERHRPQHREAKDRHETGGDSHGETRAIGGAGARVTEPRGLDAGPVTESERGDWERAQRGPEFDRPARARAGSYGAATDEPRVVPAEPLTPEHHRTHPERTLPRKFESRPTEGRDTAAERDFERKYARGEYDARPHGHEHDEGDAEDESDVSGPGKALQKINAAFGAWTLVTASISLFFATWLAVELSLTYSVLAGAVLGLAIWGLFYGLMLYLEVAAFSSLVGTMVRTATYGMRTVYEGATSMFSKSPESRAADAAAKVTAEVKKELLGDLDTDKLRDQLEQLVGSVEGSILNPRHLRQELSRVLDDTEMEAVLAENSPYFDTETIVARLRSQGHPEEKARRTAGKLKDAVGKIREESGKDKSRSEKVVDTAMRVAGVPADEAEETRQRWEQYLRNTGKAELEPESIKRDLERIFRHPREAARIVRERADMFDRDSIVSLLEQRPDMDRREAEKVVGRIMSVLSVFRSGAGEGVEGAKGTAGVAKDKIEGKLAGFFAKIDRPELRYEGVKRDFKTLFSDPREGAEAMRRRLKSMDRDTLKAIIASRREDMDEEDAEHLLRQIESVRDEALAKAERAIHKTKEKLKDARDEALHQAEQMRKAAASAAWWAFGTALVSGIAAAFGGMVAVWT